jgi:hypothetical protein
VPTHRWPRRRPRPVSSSSVSAGREMASRQVEPAGTVPRPEGPGRRPRRLPPRQHRPRNRRDHHSFKHRDGPTGKICPRLPRTPDEVRQPDGAMSRADAVVPSGAACGAHRYRAARGPAKKPSKLRCCVAPAWFRDPVASGVRFRRARRGPDTNASKWSLMVRSFAVGSCSSVRFLGSGPEPCRGGERPPALDIRVFVVGR